MGVRPSLRSVSTDAMPDAIAPSRSLLTCPDDAGAAGAVLWVAARSPFNWATNSLRFGSLSSVPIRLSSERVISAWLAGVGAEAACAGEAGGAGPPVALLMMFCSPAGNAAAAGLMSAVDKTRRLVTDSHKQ